MNSIEYTIPSISCKHCVHTIKTELLEEVQGIQAVEANLEDKKILINYAPPATPDIIVDLLKAINYPPEI
ncbi:MAG: heavy-metal-associated domain-containing protein [Anaerolineaceae bacterium]|nr:heavy-metal-associated domain-containing protein [Anaerolineaceae bacterium]